MRHRCTRLYRQTNLSQKRLGRGGARLVQIKLERRSGGQFAIRIPQQPTDQTGITHGQAGIGALVNRGCIIARGQIDAPDFPFAGYFAGHREGGVVTQMFRRSDFPGGRGLRRIADGDSESQAAARRAIVAGRQVKGGLERARKRFMRLVAGFERNLDDRPVSVAQARRRPFQTQPAHVLRNAFAGESPEDAMEVKRRKAGHLGQFRQRKIAVEVLFEMLDRASDAASIIVAGGLARHQISLL
jgi:hypothetical protein